MYPDLSIIIVNWNLPEDTIECIDSLLHAGAALTQIIIVDNGSTDGSITRIRQYYQDAIFIIEAKENLGYAAGANIGIQHSLNNNCEWLLLLNNDTIVAEDFIQEMYRATDVGNEFSILTPIIYFYGNRTKILSLSEKRIDHTLFTADKYKNGNANQIFPQLVPIDFSNGCAMMVHRKVFEKIGLFDASLFMYGEEVDFCWRAKLNGFRFACFTPAHIWHKISKSSRSSQSYPRYLKIRNQIYFYQRYAHGSEKPIYFFLTLLRIIKICILDSIRWQLALVTPTLQGWWDGWFRFTSTVIR